MIHPQDTGDDLVLVQKVIDENYFMSSSKNAKKLTQMFREKGAKILKNLTEVKKLLIKIVDDNTSKTIKSLDETPEEAKKLIETTEEADTLKKLIETGTPMYVGSELVIK